MAPTPTLFNYNHIQTHSDESEDDDGTTPTFRPLSAARRNIPSHTTFSCTTPSTPLHFEGLVPFSWEKVPGIPKYQESNKKSKSTRRLLPLPPAGNAISAATTKLMPHHQEEKSPKMDPFLLALVECSKDDDNLDHDANLGNLWKGSSKNIITRTLSDRFGFISMYGSCKRSTHSVSESIVYLPRSTTPHYLFNRRSS